jgi:hypothetical protein
MSTSAVGPARPARRLEVVAEPVRCRNGCDAPVEPGLAVCRRCHAYELTAQLAQLMLKLDKNRR